MILSPGSRGQEVLKLQRRLKQLNYLEEPEDGIFGPATVRAVRMFQQSHGLEVDGIAGAQTLEILFSDQALPRPEPSDAGTIGEDEAKHQWVYIKKALDSQTAEDRQKALGEGFMHFGMRFMFSLDNIVTAGVGGKIFKDLLAEAQELFMSWLTGRKFTNRADEDERRAKVAAMIIQMAGEMGPLFDRIAALAILKLPEGHVERNVTLAHQALLRNLERCRADGNPDGQVLTIHHLLRYDLEPTDRSLELIQQGELILDQVSNPDIRLDFQGIAAGYYIKLAISERDRGDADAQQRWAEMSENILDQILEENINPSVNTAKNLALSALLLETMEKTVKAAETYAKVVEMSEPQNSVGHAAAEQEGRLRLSLGEYERVVAVLSPVVSIFEENYLTAVEDAEIRSEGKSFSNVVKNLAFAHAYLGQWEEAIRNLERGKSLRMRYQAALRKSPGGQHLLELETALHALSRGAPLEVTASEVERTADWVGQEVSLHSKILEEYRTQRPELAEELLESPSIREISASLAKDEAVAIVGLSFKGMLLAVILPGDEDLPTGRFLLDEWPMSRVAQMFIGEQYGGWLLVVGAYEAEINRNKWALDQLLTDMEEAIGKPLASLLKSKAVRQITIIPHLLLHLLPFWALPSLMDYEVVMFPSAAHYIKAGEPTKLAGRKALIVNNPTLDLPVSPAETASVRHHLETLSMEVTELAKGDATEESMVKALSDVAVFHFCGHGRSELMHPTLSALLVHPDLSHIPEVGDDPFQSLIATVEEWRRMPDYERYADIPGVGRLFERDASRLEGTEEVVERRLEYAASGTLWGHYQNEKLNMLAELWTAGDIMVQESLRHCRLAFLSACESGTVGFAVDIDEYSGLPAALQLAGVSTIVSTLWPVSDVLTALYVDLFYEEIARSPQHANIPAVVMKVGKKLQTMKKAEAASLLNDIRQRTPDSEARYRFEVHAHKILQGDGYPFSHPYDWAAFYVTGTGKTIFAGEV